jgi:hypothetical protein
MTDFFDIYGDSQDSYSLVIGNSHDDSEADDDRSG